MSNAITQISSLGVRHVSTPYSKQIGCMPSVKTLLPSVAESHVFSSSLHHLSC